ncbi:endonuclease/exonuclease/phosphatase [Deinococcus grandis]|uniref:Endonuclease/exonuclease/phosphatase n=1 Tax=Deinococcus grandis TaxID=57498 RepID=A0A100HNG6_9DEIO|nr:ribbon-helix-helix domain-containing protein [Deinococcus grandis]GAQ23951.1 endonuclease/exonuclease/phosphatase [Deinococcus grandis]
MTLTPEQERNLARRCDQCWKPRRACQCVTFEGVHGHAYAGGGPAETQATWGDHSPDHRTWWGRALRTATEEAARLADVLPGSPAAQAWLLHAVALRGDLHALGYDYPFAPLPQRVSVPVELNQDLIDQLNAMAAEQGVTVSHLIRTALGLKDTP